MTIILELICAFCFATLAIQTYMGRVKDRELKLEMVAVRNRFSQSEMTKETLIAANKALQGKVDALTEERETLIEKDGLKKWMEMCEKLTNDYNSLRSENLRLNEDNRQVWTERQKHALLQKTLEDLRPMIDSPQLKAAHSSLKHTQIALAALARKVNLYVAGSITKEELKSAADDTASTAGEFNNAYEAAMKRAETTTALMEDFGRMLPAPKAEEDRKE